jgi:hypothetical protein
MMSGYLNQKGSMKFMRKITRPVCFAAVLFLIGLMAFRTPDGAAADGGECLTRMSAETAAYIREMRIAFKGADAELYANRREQVYLLSSEEQVKLNPRRPQKSTVAVINHRGADGRGSFYVIEQEVAAGGATLTLKRGAQVLQTLRTRLPTRAGRVQGAQAVPDKCDCTELDAYAAQRGKELQAEANRLCITVQECLPYCSCPFGKQTVAFNWTIFPPSWRSCRTAIKADVRTKNLWLRVADSTLLDDAFDTAVEKAAVRYTF